MLLLLLLLLLFLEGFQSQKEGFELKCPRFQKAQEGLCTYIPCTFTYPNIQRRYYGIYGYWFKKGPSISEDVLVATNDQMREVEKEALGRFHLVGDPGSMNCSLSIRDIQGKDRGYYFFRVESGSEKFSYLNYQVKLDVRDLIEKPDIYIPRILEPKTSVKLMCAAPWVCGEGTPPIFIWRGAAFSSLGPSQKPPYFSELTLSPRPKDHGSNLTCQMTFPGSGAHTETTVQLNVAYPIKTFGISADWEQERGLKSSLNHTILKDESLRLLCQADSNPPAFLSWSHGGQVVLSSGPSRAGILVLHLPRLGVKDGGEYRCQAQYRMDTLYATLNLSVIYAPENLKVRALWPNRTGAIMEIFSSLVVLVGESLLLECAADSSPPADMSWTRGSQALNSSLRSSPGMLYLELSHVQAEDGGEYTCHAQNEWGTQNISLNLSVQYPPRLFKSFCSRTDEGLLCACSIQAEPSLSLIWWVGERRVEDNRTHDILQVKSTNSGAWTNGSLILKEKWDLDLNLRCEGRNQHGVHSVIVLIVSDRTRTADLTFFKGALLGTGITGLLIFCLMLTYKKFLRKKEIEPEVLEVAGSQNNMEEDYVNLDVNQRRVLQPPPPDPVIPNPPDELHYASLNFRSPNVKNQETHTQYSEIKFCSGGKEGGTNSDMK
ncbi:sialic acid-binding Ig-like lectin 10 isoform X1 [Macrotis lagotis]|uniref:sialic acid-binding Ig-like lectin 10 isoform X1 n=1 Tax=Macrotis lagotis TaxID=92651 RepID=UPI003D69F962